MYFALYRNKKNDNMKERILTIFATVMLASSTFAAIPVGYYDDAVGLSGEELQQALAVIINHSDPGYSSLWTIYQSTDCRSDGKVWDMYSATSTYTFGSDQCGNYSGEGDCYNREHSIPKSWVKGNDFSDVHIVIPTDGYINGRRGNYPFGEVGSSSYVSDNSFSKLGTCTTSGYSGTVFEPNDEYKGGFARIYFYAATRYCNAISGWENSENIFTTSFPHLTQWHKQMLLRWHELDPVSQKEIDRNDAVYKSKQANRNPFVDYPELVDHIFGSKTTVAFNPEGGAVATPSITTPSDATSVAMGSVAVGSQSTQTLSIKGTDLTKNISLYVTGGNSGYFDVSVSSLTPVEVENGATITITYAPATAGSHATTLVIADGGLPSEINVSLTGTATVVDQPVTFEALAATSIENIAFVANWTEHADATSYQLSVWQQVASVGASQTIFDTAFAGKVPSGWTSDATGSITTGEKSDAIRLGSSKKDGVVISPNIDLSKGGELTIKCSPYNNDASLLYVLVDGTEVATIDCSSGEVVETVTLHAATSSSTITLKALKGKRVYLYSARLVESGAGEPWELLDGYPVNVGNETSYAVQNLTPLTTYRYQVTAFSGNVEVAVSDYIAVTTIDDDFRALEESNLTNMSFNANWTALSRAIGYRLSVWKYVSGVESEETLFDVSFASGVPSGWASGGYTATESGSIRLASGSNDGLVTTPKIDLSNGGKLTVTCAPYRTTDNSVLYILVDGVEAAQVNCASGEVTQEVILPTATTSSTITFKASKSHRVYLKSASLSTLLSGGSSWEMLDEYPCNVGNVTTYKVDNLDIVTTYRYQVEALDEDGNVLGTTDYIELTTYELPTAVEEIDVPDFYVYAYNGTIYIDDAPLNAHVCVYALDGVLCSTRTIHSTRECINVCGRGIYIVHVVTEKSSYTKQIAVVR